jgi:hypothetical protein
MKYFVALLHFAMVAFFTALALNGCSHYSNDASQYAAVIVIGCAGASFSAISFFFYAHDEMK